MTSFSTHGETQEAMALNPDVLPSTGNHMAGVSSRRAMHRALQTATSLQGQCLMLKEICLSPDSTNI